ncbi:hypothetical protein [Mycobacterium hubeiense]|uniref:hypothetical protein n=1 Tax=Mycobacterium hubeiense TaxID=1867256 RepID=UPI000C7F1A77|nr:hypothetical protein [Mycobacterium sp. QGD 101]
MLRGDETGAELRRRIVRIHARIMFVITVVATAVATVGWQDRGPYRVLADQPLGYMGLYQAYVLMFLIAVVAFIGAGRWPSRLWNASMLCAHLAPLSAILIGREVIAATDSERILYVSLAIHIPLICLETFALLWKLPVFRLSR